MTFLKGKLVGYLNPAKRLEVRMKISKSKKGVLIV